VYYEQPVRYVQPVRYYEPRPAVVYVEPRGYYGHHHRHHRGGYDGR
jgi:hypothetical protein